MNWISLNGMPVLVRSTAAHLPQFNLFTWELQLLMLEAENSMSMQFSMIQVNIKINFLVMIQILK